MPVDFVAVVSSRLFRFAIAPPEGTPEGVHDIGVLRSPDMLTRIDVANHGIIAA
jgi:hypothetical protein